MNKIRLAINQDIPKLLNLINQAYRPSFHLKAKTWTHESDLISGNRIQYDQLKNLINQKKSYLLIYLNSHHDILGCIHLNISENHCYIGTFAIDIQYQNLGLGKNLLEYAEQYCIKNFNIHQFKMVVISQRTELIEFYLRRGYFKIGEISDYPIHANIGTPNENNITIETLIKSII